MKSMQNVRACACILIALLPALSLAATPSTRPSSKWKPPVVDAPANRVGGAARAGDVDPTLLVSLLAPAKSVGLTASVQPTLYWYITKPTTVPVEITLTPLGPGGMDLGADPIFRVLIPKIDAGGVQSLSLANPPGKQASVSLKPGVQYAWVVEVVVREKDASDNPSATTRLQCIQPSTSVAAAPLSPSADQYNTFREAGLWYDLLDSLNRMLATDPNATDLRLTRRELLSDQDLIEGADGKIAERPATR